MNNPDSRTVIVADGSFPVHDIPLQYLQKAERIICCDGSTQTLLNAGFMPDAIIGDMDSLDEELAIRFADRIFQDDDQETNDLTKAVTWCREKGYNDLVIVGATGKREDHTIGNISLLAEYVSNVNVLMISDTGYFFPLMASAQIDSFTGQQVSIFSIDCETEITTSGLRYALKEAKVKNWWQATLNESLGERFHISFSNGRLIVYLKFR
ncbi:MAG: thiamine diphosphokinase [Methanosarcina sp.]